MVTAANKIKGAVKGVIVMRTFLLIMVLIAQTVKTMAAIRARKSLLFKSNRSAVKGLKMRGKRRMVMTATQEIILSVVLGRLLVEALSIGVYLS